MKKYILYTTAGLLLVAGIYAFKPEEEKKWEMKQYYFVMLSKGSNRGQDSATAAKLQEGHMANINSMAEAGKLCIAGPFGDDGNWRGIFILNVKTQEEAKALLEKDPAIAAGRLKYEMHPWWGGVGSALK